MSPARRRSVGRGLAALTATAFAACSFTEPDWSGKRCGGVDGTCPQGWRCDAVSSTCTTDPAGAPSSSGAGAAGGEGGASAGGSGGGDCPDVPEDCATPGDDDCDGTANDHCALWHHQYKDDATVQLPFDVAIDPVRGNVVAAGQSTTAPNDNAMIIGLAAGGMAPWVHNLGDAAAQEVQGVGFDAAGNVLVAGIFKGTLYIVGDLLVSNGDNDIFVAKFTATGEPVWAKALGGIEREEVHSMTVLPDGGMILAGSTFGESEFGPPPGTGRNAMVARLDSGGGRVWSKVFGGDKGDSANEARVAGNGSVVVVGDFGGTVDFGGGQHVADGQDVFVARWSLADGSFVSAHSFGGPLNQVASCVALGADGDVYVTGTFEDSLDILGQAQLEPVGTRDVFVARLSPTADGATHVWSRGFGGPGATQKAESVGLIGDRVYLAGALEGTVDFGGGALTVVDAPDVYVAALDAASGAHVWSRRFGLSGNQGFRGVAMDAQPNGLVISGDFGDGSVDFGAGVLAAGDSGDAFIVQLEP
jgi:hypothetical protein